MPCSPLPRWLPIAIATSLAGAAALFIWLLASVTPPGAPDVGEAATVLRVPRPIPAFELEDHRGERFDTSRLTGRWTFLFFGYTFCPDVCPNTLGNLRSLRGLIDESREHRMDDVQFVFISVDPERDTRERLAQYVPYFHDEFIGASGRAGEIEALTDALGIYYARSDEDSGDPRNYLVDHSSAVLLVDPVARLLAVFSHPDDPEAMARAFEKIQTLGEAAQ